MIQERLNYSTDGFEISFIMVTWYITYVCVYLVQ